MNKAPVYKPFLRGHFHQSAFFFGLGACAMLIVAANSIEAQISAVIYSVCLLLLFGMSSLYHRINWSEKNKQWLQKLDHSAIFIFIAGSSTPVCVVGMSSNGPDLLLLVWLFALAGIFKEFFWKKSPRWSSGIFYVIMGWLVSPYIGQFYTDLGVVNTWLLIAGGIVYTVGAVIYAFRWPNPSPKVFGYHEVFHALVIVASVLHFIVIYDLLVKN